MDLPKRFCEDAKGILTNILRDTKFVEQHFKSEEIDFLNELSGHYIAQEIESVIYGHQILSLRSYSITKGQEDDMILIQTNSEQFGN